MDYWGGGQRVCWPPLPNYWGGPGPPLAPPLPTPMNCYWNFLMPPTLKNITAFLESVFSWPKSCGNLGYESAVRVVPVYIYIDVNM